MAKFKVTGPPAFKKNGSTALSRDMMDAQTNIIGEDPFVLIEDGDFLPESKNTSTKAMIKEATKHDEIALPIPIAAGMPLGKIVTADGREHAVYQPIPGFEHLFNPQQPCFKEVPSSRNIAAAPCKPVKARIPKTSQQNPKHVNNTNEDQEACNKSTCRTIAKLPCTPRIPKAKTLKRSRSVAQGLPSARPLVREASEDDDDDQDCTASSEESYTFYIGDFEKLKQFLRRRFDELTMKPLRGIITQWIKQLEPRRLGAYGRYHKKLPCEESEEMTPPWWPRDVHYNEPSHLPKKDLLTLAVDVMLLHRRIDEVKRKGSWIAKLRQVALYNIETTPSENFSSSKGSNFSDLMRDRALKSILPSLFDVASSYEEHLAMYNLYEGAGGTDPKTGKYHTWQPISRPTRRPAQVKRPRLDKATPSPRIESVVDASGDETEPDNTMVKMSRRGSSIRPKHMQKESQTSPMPVNIADPQQQSWRVEVESPVASTMHAMSARSQSQQSFYLPSPLSTPRASFDDVKGGKHTPSRQHETYSRCNMPLFSQPIQYASGHPGYNSQMYQPLSSADSFSHSAPSPFPQIPAPDMVGSFQMPMFDGTYSTQVQQASYMHLMPSNTHGYSYECEGMFGPPTMDMTVPSTDLHPPFHNLPMGFNADGR